MPTMAQLFAEGYMIGESIPRTARARAAAKDKFGAAADDPQLFGQLQDMQMQRNQDQRADNADQRAGNQDRRAESAEGRAAGTYKFEMGAAKQNKQREATLSLVNGLRAARDRGDDVTAAFDKLVGTLPELGIDPGDLPDMKAKLAENPAILDDYYAALQDGTKLTAAQANAAQKKADAEASAAEGRKGVSDVVDRLRGYYSDLDEGKGIVNSEKDGLSNVMRWLRSSYGGQVAGHAVGSDNQRLRDQIESIRPHLINAIKSAENLGAKMFDSNKDMEMWLATVSDPGKDVNAAIEALDAFESRYGEQVDKLKTPQQQQNQAAQRNQVYPGFVKDGWRFKGGAPGDKNSWERVN